MIGKAVRSLNLSRGCAYTDQAPSHEYRLEPIRLLVTDLWVEGKRSAYDPDLQTLRATTSLSMPKTRHHVSRSSNRRYPETSKIVSPII
jgi:hypothetical protein